MFFVVAIAIWALAHLYVVRRLVAVLTVARAVKRALYLLGAAAFVLSPATLAMSRASESEATAVEWAGLAYLGFFTIVFFFMFVRDVVLGLASLLERFSKHDKNLNPERRRFLLSTSNAAVLGISGGLAAWGVTVARQSPEVVRVDVPIRNLPEELVGYRIAQLSDIHIGPTIRGDFLRDVVRTTNRLGADLIAVTGDLVDGTVEELGPHVAPLGDLRARDGAYYVTGNHEYYWGVDAWRSFIGSLGLRVLDNVHRVIHRGPAKLVVAGVEDYSGSRRSGGTPAHPRNALEGAPTDAVRLLLAHQPRSLHGAREAGFHLQISGHTHGGQYFPWNMFIGLVHPIARGLGRFGDLQVYVNRGTGYWGPPLRGGVPPEITLIRLVRA